MNILIPTIVGGRVHLHPMVVLIGIIVGASVGGVLGIALAAPTIASLRVIGRYIHGKLFDPEPAQPTPAAMFVPEPAVLVGEAQLAAWTPDGKEDGGA